MRHYLKLPVLVRDDVSFNPFVNGDTDEPRNGENSCFRASALYKKVILGGGGTSSTEEEDLANSLVMLSEKSGQPEEKGVAAAAAAVAFQCKACKKVFGSHQALGGHRASHKKVKGCFATRRPEEGEEMMIGTSDVCLGQAEDVGPSTPARAAKGSKMHECSVCHRVFTSGQALGGHKRCHWLTTSTENALFPSFQELRHGHHEIVLQQRLDSNRQLDLNLNINLPAAPGNEGQKGPEKTKKARRLSDLRDVKYGEGWLQMGIASASEITVTRVD